MSDSRWVRGRNGDRWTQSAVLMPLTTVPAASTTPSGSFQTSDKLPQEWGPACPFPCSAPKNLVPEPAESCAKIRSSLAAVNLKFMNLVKVASMGNVCTEIFQNA
ncbi:hypothetical protein Bbelb_235950 [Branchiostoma belcheri]|nr:hypothetical protein Bbelb_235950 [Branchiostoma belcheri]